MTPVMVLEIYVFPILVAISLFPVVSVNVAFIYFSFAIVENCVAARITITCSGVWSLSVVRVNMSVKLRQFQTNSCVFDVMP